MGRKSRAKRRATMPAQEITPGPPETPWATVDGKCLPPLHVSSHSLSTDYECRVLL